MRVSSNYFERFVFGTLPFVLIGGLFAYVLKKPGMLSIFAVILAISVVIFLLDKLPLRKTKLSKVSIIDNELFINGQLLNTGQIDFIKPVKTSPPHSLLIFEVHLKDKTIVNFMDRPKTVFYRSKNKLRSKSLEILFTNFPELKSKLRAIQY